MEGAWGGQSRKGSYTPKPHFAMDVRKGLGSVAVDNAALSIAARYRLAGCGAL